MTCSCDGENQTTLQNRIKMKSNEHLLFVGTYTEKEGHVDGKADGIYALKFDSSTGQLDTTNLKVDAINPSYLSFNKETNRIYAVNEIADGTEDGGGKIQSFAYNLEKESIELTGEVSAMGGAPCYIMEHDQHLFTANYVGGNFVVYPMATDGSVKKHSQIIQHKGKGATSRQEAPHGHMITRNFSTGHFQSADLGLDLISFYSFDKASSSLSKIDSLKLPDGSGPRHMDFHPLMNITYVLNELSGSIDVIKQVNGKYESVQNIHSTYYINNQEAGCGDIHIHPRGKYLYVSNRGPVNTISSYLVSKNGLLTLDSETNCGGLTPRSFAIDPSGKYLLVANQDSDNIVVFEINEETGRLVDLQREFKAPTPVCLKF